MQRKVDIESNFNRLKKELASVKSISSAMFYRYTANRAKKDNILISEPSINTQKDSILLKDRLDEADYQLYNFNDTTRLSPITISWYEEIAKNTEVNENSKTTVSPIFKEIFRSDAEGIYKTNSILFVTEIADPSLFVIQHILYTNALAQNKEIALSEQIKLKERREREQQRINAVNAELQKLAQLLNEKFKKGKSAGYDFVAIDDYIEFIANVSDAKSRDWGKLHNKLYDYCYKQQYKVIELEQVTDVKQISKNTRITDKNESLGILRYSDKKVIDEPKTKITFPKMLNALGTMGF